MKVRTLLLAAGLTIGPERRYDWQTKTYEESRDGAETFYDEMYAVDKYLLLKHLDDEVLDYAMFGKLAAFSIRLRGSVLAMFFINMINGSNLNKYSMYGSTALNRLHSAQEYACARNEIVALNDCKLTQRSSNEFKALIVMRTLEDKK